MDTDPKKVVVKKPGGKSPIVINPPEKTLTGGHNEAFQISLQKNISICETKTKIILQAKAAKFDIPEEVVYKVFVRGQRAFPASASITREQYAMDHVNSFINGGAAMEKEWDLIPTQIDERLHTRMGTKGTGGARRAHIKREKSPYNGKMIYHVVDRRGVIKHSTQDEMQAKRHLASKYRAYMESTSDQSPIVIDEARASAAVKLSQAWDQRKQSSEASRARAAAAKAEFEKQWQEKQSKPKQGVAEAAKWRSNPDAYDVDDEGNKTPRNPNSPKFGYDPLQRRAATANDAKTPRGKTAALITSLKMAKGNKGVSGGDKKPYPKTWHDVDPELGKQVDNMSQAEKVEKGLAHPDTLKKQGVAEGFNGEYDDEAGMAQSNLLTTARAVMGLLKTIKDRDNLPEWGQEKIAKAEMMLVSVWDYLQSQKAMGNDPQQGVAEGDAYIESLQTMMERQLEPTMDLDAWVDNFQNADPQKYHQFKNKTPEKKKVMAAAALYKARQPKVKKQ